MHGHSPGSALLVNAEVDSMGGVVDGGISLDTKTSPRRAAIEKAQAELRQEFDVREERRRELEFLEKGGNPLDFKLGPATSISVQSTSLTDQLGEQYVVSEAKGSFALAASPHGDSVDSSGRPGPTPARDPNSADNLLLLDGENDVVNADRNSMHPSKRSKIAQSVRSSQLDGSLNAKESEDSTVFRLGKSQAYARRNRSRSNRDSGHGNATDLGQSGHGNGTSLVVPSSRRDSRDAKEPLSDAQKEKEPTGSSICHLKTMSLNGNAVVRTPASENQLDMEVDAVQAPETSAGHMKVGDPEKGLDTEDRNQNKSSQVGLEKDSSAAALASQKEEQVQFSPEYGDADAKEKSEKHANADQPNGCSFLDTNANISPFQNKENGFFSPKGVDSESFSLDRFATGDQCSTLRKGNGSSLENSTEFMTAQLTPPVNNEVKETKDPITVELNVVRKDDHEITEVKMEEENDRGRCDLQIEAESNGQLSSKSDRKLDTSLCDESNSRKASLGLQARSPSRLVLSNGNVVDAVSSEKESTTTACEVYNTLVNKLKNQADEDEILEKARIIEANRKRLGELSVSSFHSEKRKKSHWDFVLEEMAWLANDFMQERLWKTTAAAQMSHWVAFGGFKKFNEENLHQKQKNVARTLAKAIIQFWKSAEVLFRVNSSDDCNTAASDSQKGHVLEAIKDKDNATIIQQTSNSSEEQKSGQENLAIQGYAVRFLKFISSCSDQPVQAEAPTTPDRISDLGILEISWEDQLSEESLIYTLPAGAMEDYRKSVESLWAEYEKIGDFAQQEVHEVSLRDSVSEYGAQDNPYEEEGETGSYYLPRGYEGFKSSKFVQKKKKHLQRSYTARSYDVAHELPYRHSLENRLASKQVSMGKRPSSALNVGSIPIKRVRTAARQRVVGPFIVGGNSGAQVASKTDASSGDTSSLQDDQSSLHGGSQLRKNSEVESTGEFGKQFPFDGADTSPKAKKKKKPKHVLYRNSLNTAESGGFVMSGQGSTFDQTFQLDVAQHEQRDLSKRKLENHQFESNGSIGIYGPHAKKPKLLKQVSEASPDALGPINGSLPSPVASHISNMSNPNKLIRMITNRAPGRKAKGLKIISTTPSGSGSPWSNLEDQALVVLVHDMGPNWELVSDAMNSSLHFKCTFRKPKECKERHKVLMDQNSGDGADSVEDSGSSQPYPSTLPGIPKGSARQLFQHLQGPMEEDMLKAHFEKIILIGKQLRTRRIKNDNQEGKQLTPVHSSHFHSLSQGCSNNSNAIPTPLDFCDAPASSPDGLALGYQGSHPNSLAVPNNQGSMGTVLPTSGASPMIQGTSGMVLGNGVSSSPAAINPSPRDAHRFGVPRSTSLPMDEQQRLQQYSQMISGRNIAQPAMTTSGAMQVGNDRGVRMLPGGNGVGMMCSMNRSIGMPRPGFQGMGSPGMLNMVSSGGMISSSGVGMPSPVNLHTGPISGQANSMLRSRDTLAMTRPGQNAEDQRHLMMQELQIQVPQANGQSVSTHFNSLSTPYTNQTVPPPVQNFPAQHPPQHQMAQQPHVLNSPHHSHLQGSNSSSPQQQAYAFRLAKERHLQQRLMHQQPHQFTSTPSVPQSQHPISPVQNGSPASGSPASLPHSNTQHPLNPSSSPMNPIPSQVQAKHTHSLSRNPPPTGTLSNQMLKQRQRQQQLQQQQQQQQQLRQQQQQQQQQRSHPQSRQQSHPQQQPKHVKGLGRGSSVIMHQNLTVDPSHVNGLSPGSQVSEKGEPAMHLMQSQGLYSGGVSGSSLVQPGKQLSPQLSNPSTQQQKLFPRATQKQHPQIPSHMDGNNQGQVPQVTSNQTLLPTQQTVPSSPLPRQASQSQQSVQRMLPQSGRQSAASDTSVQGPTDQVQINQMGPNSAVSQCMDAPGIGLLVSSSATSSSQWKAEPSLYDTSSPVVQLTSVGNSPQTSSAGSELGPTPIQPMVQRQLSGGTVPSHGNNIGGQWQQQSQTPPQQQQTQQQQQQRHAQGNLYARTSNSGQG